MKRNKFIKLPLLLGLLFLSSSIYSQGTPILYNQSFENGVDPEGCLGYRSCGTSDNGVVYEEDPTNLFASRANWTSFWMFDPATCNFPYTPCNYDPDNPDASMCQFDWWVHSPDLVGGAVTTCPYKAWGEDYMVGMGPYEVIWQDFYSANGSQVHADKSYEVRIKVYTELDQQYITDKSLCVMLGTTDFTYLRDEKGFWDPFNTVDYSLHCCTNDGYAGSECAQCDNNYRGFLIGPTDDIRLMKRFPISDLVADGYGAYSYGRWYEFHFKMNMSDYNFTDPLYPAEAFKHFGIDIRDPYELDNSDDRNLCVGPYLLIDQVEFFEWCPDHFDIYGAMIAGTQSEYAAQTSITAGTVDVTKGPSIITNTGKTEFIAGHYVELIPGFLADVGSVVDMTVDPGFNCSNYRSMSVDASFVEADRNEVDRKTPSNNVNDVMVQSEESVKVFPNPTGGVFTISAPKNQITLVSIFDNLGNTVKIFSEINKGEYSFDISSLDNGTYYLVINTKNGDTYREKLVKN